MDWLNYHHLYYFWTVAKEGSVTAASKKLLLAQPTVSGQLRELENSLGEKLFQKSGRNLVLTATGQTVFRYADEIFALGREMQDTLKGRPTGRPMRFVVGITDVLPKWVAHRLLVPALRLTQPLRMVCLEDKPDRLFAELSVHNIDLVLSDTPMGSNVKVRAFTHLLGECGLSFFGTRSLTHTYREGFPQSLENAPFLLPTAGCAMRRSLDQWFDRLGFRPNIEVECEDSALLKVFGQSGAGIFAAPTAVESEVKGSHDLEVIGRVDDIKERFYAISVERKLKHPAVVAITDAARQQFLAPSTDSKDRPG